MKLETNQTEQYSDIVVPMRIIEAVDTVNIWAQTKTDRSDWAIGPVCSRKYAETLKQDLVVAKVFADSFSDCKLSLERCKEILQEIVNSPDICATMRPTLLERALKFLQENV